MARQAREWRWPACALRIAAARHLPGTRAPACRLLAYGRPGAVCPSLSSRTDWQTPRLASHASAS